MIIELSTKLYVDSLHENRRNRRDFSTVFNGRDNEFDNSNLSDLDSITVIRDPSFDNELANKNYVDDSFDGGKISKFDPTLQNYLKACVGNIVYNFTKYDKIQITDKTIVTFFNAGGYPLQQKSIKCNDKKNSGKIQNFIKSTKTNSPTGYSGATSLPPIGNSFLYIETSSNNHGNNVFFSAWNEQILYNVLILLSIITDFHF